MPADFVTRGQKLCAEGQYQEAVKVCRLGLLAHPTEIEGRLVLGGALMSLRRYDEVLAEMRVALELEAENARALALKGEALLRKGDALQASDVLARAVSAAPADPAIRDLYGEARRVREGGALAPPTGPSPFDPPPLAPPPRAGARFPVVSTPIGSVPLPSPRTLGVGDKSGTIEIDPDIEGVEVEHSSDRLPGYRPSARAPAAARAPARQSRPLPRVEDPSDAAIELSSVDLISSAEETAAPRGPARRSGGWPSAGPTEPTQALHHPQGMRSVGSVPQREGPRLDEMFPEDEEGVSGIDVTDAPRDPVARHEDMRMIRRGLGLAPEGSTAGRNAPRGGAAYGYAPTDTPPSARAPDRGHVPVGRPPQTERTRRRGIPLIVYAVLALLVVGGAVLAGFKVRDMRLGGQIDQARESAEAAAARDTYPGYQHAIEAYGRIRAARDTEDNRAASAAVAARMAAEVGEGLDEARKQVAALGDNKHPRATLARGLLALAEGDAPAARGAAASLATADAASPDALYLRGRAALLEGKPGEAAEALRAATEANSRPTSYVALAQAEAELGRMSDALTALDRAVKLSPGHVAATILRARIQARAIALPGLPEPEQSLEAIIAEGKAPAGNRKLGASPGQIAWASVALAEVKLARGDRGGARDALAGALTAQAPGDVAFRPALAELLIGLGDAVAARAQVDLAVTERKGSPVVRLLQARVALASGDSTAAIAALAEMGDIAGDPEALALRGRARLEAGAVDQAAGDLDAALALRPDLQAAQVARAEVDLARGDPRTAQKRLEPMVATGVVATPEVVAAYAAARRASGDVDGARQVLTKFVQAQPDQAGNTRLLLERARIDRAAGAYQAAAESLRKAIEVSPRAIEARLEAGTLALDRGDAAGARTQLDSLVAEVGQSGPVLIEAARMRTVTGDHKGAEELLERAGKLTSPGALLARERGRLYLRRRDGARAMQDLERARGLDPKDRDVRVLLMQTYLMRKNGQGAARELEDVTKSFRGSALVALARGMEALVRNKPRDGFTELTRAHQLASEAKATPRELAVAAFWAGHAAYLFGDLAGAGEWLKKALLHDPGMADAHFLLGQIAFEAGQGDRMVVRYEKAIELDPSGNPSAWYFLGEHYALKAKADKAKSALETYLSRWPEGDFAADAKELLAKLK